MIHHSAGGARGVIAQQHARAAGCACNLRRGLQKRDGKVCGEEGAA